MLLFKVMSQQVKQTSSVKPITYFTPLTGGLFIGVTHDLYINHGPSLGKLPIEVG